MKKIFSFLMGLSLSFVMAQTGIGFDEGNFSSLLVKAKKENKLVFLDAYASWCGPCKLMAKNVFTTQEVGDFYNANFINAKIDMEKGEGIDLAKKYNVKAYPTYLWINSDGEVVHTGTGYYEPAQFIQVGQEANDPTKQVVFLKKKFDDGDKDLNRLRSFYKAMAYRDDILATAIAKRYFDNKTIEAYTEEEAMMLVNSIKNMNDDFHKIFTRDKAQIVAVMPQLNIDTFEHRLKVSNVVAKAYNRETKTLDEKVFIQEAEALMTKELALKELNGFKIRLALSKKEYANYEKLALEHYKDAKSFDANELNSTAWNFYEKIDNKKSLLKAVEWAIESVKKDESYYNTDTLAHLYKKLGDKENAKKWAEKSIELGKTEGEDVAGTQKLLDELK